MAAGRKSRTLAGQGLRLPDEGVSSGAGVKRACGLLNAGTELESCGRAVCTLNCRTISPAPSI